jgi:aldehyde:ferredoxin oxidoreductase
MQIIKGTSNKYLDINLTRREWTVFEPSAEDLRSFIGGKGLGLKIFNDRFSGNLGSIDPLGEENILIFAMGAMLTSGAPCTGRFEILSRSPLTNLMLASSCGGYFGEACKTAGWDGVIICGKSEAPVTIRIDEDGVCFEDAGKLWGQGTNQVQQSLNLGPREGAAVIGPAGENLVKYASICSGHRFAGRGGAGAVMGSKNIKAIVARGKSVRYEPVLASKFEKTNKKAKKYVVRNNMTKGYRAYGTNVNVRIGMETGFSPVRNFRDRYNVQTEKTSGEAMAERYSTRHSACRHCSVLCGHKGHYPDGKIRQIPEYETIGMFGSNIENYDPDLIGIWNDLMNELGMDTISAGGTIAWAMEAAEKGLRKSELKFGRTENISDMLEDIAMRVGEGDELAEGSMRLSGKYGGENFAMHVKGLECAAYDPRASWGHGLGYAVYNKGGCHLGSYMISLEQLMGYMPPHTTLGKADWVIFMEDLFSGVNSLQVCLFSVFGILTEPVIPKYLPRPVLKIATISMPKIAMALMDWSILSDYFWSITGIKMNKWEFLEAGKRINKLERWMNVQMGLKASDDTLPGRFTSEQETAFEGKNTVVPIEKMVKQYYKKRGYGPSGGPAAGEIGLLEKRSAEEVVVKPAGLLFKRIYCSVIMAVLGWFIPMSCRKEGVHAEVRAFPEDFTCRLGIWPKGASVTFRKEGDRLKKMSNSTREVDLGVYLKSVEAAWLMFSFQESTCMSEANNRLMALGELPHTCTFIRMMDKVEILLLPKFIAKRAVKKWEKVK